MTRSVAHVCTGTKTAWWADWGADWWGDWVADWWLTGGVITRERGGGVRVRVRIRVRRVEQAFA